MKCLTFEIFTHKTPNPRWGGVGLIFVYYFSLQFMTFPGLLIFWPPKIPTATPFGGGGGFFLSIFSTVHEIDRTFEIFTPNSPPPRGGIGKKQMLLIFWTVNDISRSFDPLKFPLRPPMVGGGEIFFIDFLDSSWHLPDFLNLDPQPPPRNPRGGMGKKNKFYRFSGQFMTFPGVLIFWPPKIATSTPPPWVGRSIFFRQEPSPDLQGFMQVGKYDSISHKV